MYTIKGVMTETVIPFTAEQPKGQADRPTDRMQVNVYIRADVMAPAVALRKANLWLSMNAGHLLMAENPELLLREPLQWRFDVIYSLPNRRQPGTVQRANLGKIHIDAVTGEIGDQEHLIKELTANADALAVRAA